MVIVKSRSQPTARFNRVLNSKHLLAEVKRDISLKIIPHITVIEDDSLEYADAGFVLMR
jgi:hypothetical protein